MERVSGTEHLAALDGIRAIAILGVIAVHAGQIVPGIEGPVGRFLEFGAHGVQLFFVVSGFTLALRYSEVGFEFRDFLLRRYLRIAPMFYCGIVLYLVLGRVFGLGFSAGDAGWLEIITASTYTHGWLPSTINAVVPGGWSIAAEAMFYLTFPIILMLISRPIAFALFAGTSVMLAGATLLLLKRLVPNDESTTFSFYFWLAQYPAFVFGCGLVWIVPWLRRRVAIARAALVASVLGLGLLSQIRFSGSYFATDALFAALVASCVVLSPRVLTGTAIVSIGRTSYSIYILHFAVVALVASALVFLGGIPAAVVLVACFAVVLVLSWGLSILTYRYIELPAIRAGRKPAGGQNSLPASAT